jgi:hypothetical protein
VLSQIGVEVNSKDEFEKAQAEKKQRGETNTQQPSVADASRQLGADGGRVQ